MTKRSKVWRVTWPTGGSIISETYPGWADEEDRIEVVKLDDVSLAELVETMDTDAQDSHRSEMAGVHKWLGELISEYGSQEIAAKVMRRLYLEVGGFHKFF